MREIKFRGKAKNKKCWIFGDLIHNENGYAIIERKGGCIKVKPETIGQYTGLKDKNGTKIFEGDIIKGYCEFNGKHMNGVVHFDIYNGIELKLKDDINMWHFDYLIDIEVIGNIYDSPKLLTHQHEDKGE